MKKILVLLLGVSLFAVSGCDFFRTLAGRPTSDDIEKKRIEIIRVEQAAEQARLDSIRREQEIVRDSLSALDSIALLGATILDPAKLGGLASAELEARYYVIIGAFKVRSNAERLLSKARAAGYEPTLISFNNDLIAVGLCPTGNIVEAKDALKVVKGEIFCPKGVWILVNE